jgi:LPS-assembly protein
MFVSQFKFLCALALITCALNAHVASASPQEPAKPVAPAAPIAPTAPPQQPTPAVPGVEPDDDQPDDDESPATPPPAESAKDPAKPRNRETQDEPKTSDEVHIEATNQEKIGNLFVYTGYVDATYQNIRLQADRVEFNEVTNDAVAEGNVIFDQGSTQRVTARRAELNIATKRGTFYDATGFTDRTATGEYLFYTASRIDKVGPDEYILHDADVTACEDSVPKWSLKADQAKLKVNDRVRLRNAVFDIKGKPVFYLPYASIPLDRRERQSGFLLPRFGNSNNKGFTYSQAYYQTLGRSADATLRGDVFTSRGLGFGFEFRARTDERSGFRLGTYIVKDRLFGEDGPDQGGSAFFAEGVQYLPHGWLAVTDVRVTSNLEFRRTFSDTFEEIINPQERSTLYLNNNFGRFSVNLLAESDSTNIREQNPDRPRSRSDFNINIRHLPSVAVTGYDRPLWRDWPIYFSFEAAADGLRRTERVGDTKVFETPNIVQRLDLLPRFTFPVPYDLGGWSITPSIGLRTTFYSNSLNPAGIRFTPELFTLDPNDPRLPITPGRSDASKRPILLFDPSDASLVLGTDVSRNYVDFAIDVRPPVLGAVYYRSDGTPRFKHVIEPYVVYRRITGVSNYERIPLFDERDAVANTNEVEYGITNRFFVKRRERGTANRDGGASEGQTHELLSVTVRQKYFIDPTFGDVFNPRRRNQFYPINTFSGFSYGGIERRFSPINVVARVRPLSALFADLRFDYDVQRNGIKDVAVTGGARGRNWSVNETYYFARRFRALDAQVEPGTYRGNQWITSVDLGNLNRGLHGGTRLNIDFTDRLDESNRTNPISGQRLLNTRSYLGYAWDCCGVQFNVATFNLPSGVRRETQYYVTFTLAGLGSIGNENIGQPAQTRRLNRGGGRRQQLDLPDDQ